MTMGFALERRKINGVLVWIILWSCRKTGNVIQEMELPRSTDEETDIDATNSSTNTNDSSGVQEG